MRPLGLRRPWYPSAPFVATLPDPPAAAPELVAVPGDAEVVLSWAAIAGATTYNLYFSTTPGVTKATGTKIAGASSPYTHTGRTNGVALYYVATAENDGGETADSAEVSATPAAPISSRQSDWLV